MRHTFNGVEYEIVLEPISGLCSAPENAIPVIVINEPLTKRIGLDTAIHEALHAIKFNAKEEVIDHAAVEVSKFLWKLGYRTGLKRTASTSSTRNAAKTESSCKS